MEVGWHTPGGLLETGKLTAAVQRTSYDPASRLEYAAL